jgi:hypothetical protein
VPLTSANSPRSRFTIRRSFDGVTSVYLQGIDAAAVIDAVHTRRALMIPATVGLRSAL